MEIPLPFFETFPKTVLKKWRNHIFQLGGVILATCFTHMIPEVQRFLEFNFQHGQLSESLRSMPLGEIFVLIGFYLIYTIEEVSEESANFKSYHLWQLGLRKEDFLQRFFVFGFKLWVEKTSQKCSFQRETTTSKKVYSSSSFHLTKYFWMKRISVASGHGHMYCDVIGNPCDDW